MTCTNIIPESSTVLVTGGSGFIGSHCIKELLSRNYNVKAVVRSESKGQLLKNYFSKIYGNRIEYVIVPDISDVKLLSNAMPGCSGVLHLASPYTYAVSNFEEELLKPALSGTQAVLEAAMPHASIKRIVITSSFAAIFDATKGMQPNVVLSEKDFSPLTYEDGVKTKEASVAYRASKIVAERAAWDFIKEKSPSFDIAVICPPMVYGPLVSTDLLESISTLNFSNSTIWSMSTSGPDAEVPATKGPVWVDVRDLAYSHVQALLVPEASNERFLVSAGSFCNQEICDILRKTLPEEQAKLVPIGEAGARMIGTHYTTDSSKAEKVLGVKFRSLDSSVTDLVKQLYKI